MSDNVIQFKPRKPKAIKVLKFQPCESCLTPDLCLEPPIESCALAVVSEVKKDPANDRH